MQFFRIVLSIAGVISPQAVCLLRISQSRQPVVVYWASTFLSDYRVDIPILLVALHHAYLS